MSYFAPNFATNVLVLDPSQPGETPGSVDVTLAAIAAVHCWPSEFSYPKHGFILHPIGESHAVLEYVSTGLLDPVSGSWFALSYRVPGVYWIAFFSGHCRWSGRTSIVS